MGKALLDNSGSNVTQPALISPVSPRHARANHSLVAAIVVLMVLATGALFCCCYLWERQLRLRIEATRSSTHSLQDPVGVPAALVHRWVFLHRWSSSELLFVFLALVIRFADQSSSPSVTVLLGDNIARSVAWAVPRRVPTSAVSEAAMQPTPANADQSLQKLAPS